MALTGEVAEGKAVLRSTARAGDLLAVTGVLGGSFPTGHHLSFIPRVREGGVLAASGLATAMMDLSDGLGTDLPRLAAEHFPETPFTVIGEMTTEPSSALPSGYRHFN